jgi:hypothetical protein
MKSFTSYAWRSKQPIYAFERDVSDKEAMQVVPKGNCGRSIEIHKHNDYYIRVRF